MKISIIGGTGAMGSAIGATLKEGGHDVHLIDVNQVSVNKILESGLTVENKAGDKRVVLVNATTDVSSVGVCDVVLVFVKCYHTEAAVRGATALIGDQTQVVSLQNGWGNGPRIAEIIGEEKTLVGVTYHSASLLEPGRVLHSGIGPTFLGSLDGRVTDRAMAIGEALAVPNFEVQSRTSVLTEIWKKLALNVCTLPTSGLLRFGAGELGEHPGTLDLMRVLLEETIQVAQAKGVDISFEERWTTITELLGRVGKGKSSMLQDVEARRSTEIDVINGAIVAAGKELDIPTPVNQTMVWLIEALQETFQ